MIFKGRSGGTKIRDPDTITIKTNSTLSSLEGKEKEEGREEQNVICSIFYLNFHLGKIMTI